jgi:diketogulonate reductase-like aldo/keto reductase
MKFLENPMIKAIGKKYQKTNAQVLLKWALQQGVGK